VPDFALLKECLDRLAADYGPQYLDTDPLGVVHEYTAPEDIEVAGFAVSALGYGGARQIRQSAHAVLARTGDSPARFAAETAPEKMLERFRGLKHRWSDEGDIAFLFRAAGEMIREYGSIGAFVRTLDHPAEETVEGTMTRFAEWIRERYSDDFRRNAARTHISYLVPSPADGSACKRPAMYFRWMVRGPDGIDFGLWTFISPARLVIPVDTHIARMGRILGLTSRKSADWKMALEITRALRALDPADPVRYDFALVRPGILGECPPSGTGTCRECALCAVCREAKSHGGE
jgi:uncharacterized protein (TIGR02757 family)